MCKNQKPKNINDLDVSGVDVFLCCHGRQIVKKKILDSVPWCVNIHPCLYKYKGAEPIKRMLADGETTASVGAHRMTEEVDAGKVIFEGFQTVEGKTVLEVYNELYPLYAVVVKTAFVKMEENAAGITH